MLFSLGVESIVKVAPLYKSGPPNSPGNYRPISVLPIVSKIMERVLHDELYNYVTKFELLSDCQFGFRKFHSTSTALLDCTNSWYMNMDRKKFNLVVLVELKKAFDTADHEILSMKLEIYSIKGPALSLLRSYLVNCTQKCQINGSTSSERIIKCGVLQGSILGPLLFLVYINDLPNCLNRTNSRLFADDTNLTATGESISDVEMAMNSDLEGLRKCIQKPRGDSVKLLSYFTFLCFIYYIFVFYILHFYVLYFTFLCFVFYVFMFHILHFYVLYFA